MTGELTTHQRDALARYRSLMETRDDWFTGRHLRPIVRDPAVLATFAGEHRVVLGVVAATPYGWLLNDLVESRDHDGGTVLHPYLRLVAPPDEAGSVGVVVLATVREPETEPETGTESIVLLEQERHTTGTLELELPRGFGRADTPPEAQALRELAEETGYLGTRAERLGETLTDSGMTDSAVAFFHVVTTGRAGTGRPETQEAIAGVTLVTRDELWARIDSGAVRDAFTVQALALYERRLATQRG